MQDGDPLPQSNSESAEDEYEEALVYVRFDDFEDVEFFKKSSEIRLENVGNKNPTCYIDGFRFGGRHEVNLGTVLFFEKGGEGSEINSSSSGTSSTTQREGVEQISCVAMTDRALRFSLREIPIVPRSEIEGNTNISHPSDGQQRPGHPEGGSEPEARMQS
jgi:hypothetical protein